MGHFRRTCSGLPAQAGALVDFADALVPLSGSYPAVCVCVCVCDAGFIIVTPRRCVPPLARPDLIFRNFKQPNPAKIVSASLTL